MRYLIDTSSFIDMVERHWYDRLVADERVTDLMTIPDVLRELETLAQGGGTRARNARSALRFARQTLKVAHGPVTERHADDALIASAREHAWGIISQDHALISRAREHGIPTLTLTRSGSIGD